MFASGLESNITAGLDFALHDIFLQEISDLLAKEYFFLNIDGISEGLTLLDFVSGFDSEFMKHFIVSNKSAHHSFEKSTIEHKGRFMNESGHVLNDVKNIINLMYETFLISIRMNNLEGHYKIEDILNDF